MDLLDIYRDCVLIRKFERRVEKEFELGKFRGTTHGCIGQEIIPVLVMSNIDHEKDYVTGTHRCHGQVLAYTHDPYRLACEMMGRTDGFNCGMGGSQHIKTGRYITNGVTGGMAAVGTGMACFDEVHLPSQENEIQALSQQPVTYYIFKWANLIVRPLIWR